MFGLSRVERRDDQYTATMRQLSQQRIQPTYAGVSARYQDMLSIPAVWKSLQLTAGIISVMPLDGYTKRAGEVVELDPAPRLLVSPSATVPLEDWVFQNIESMIMHGDAIGRIVSFDRLGYPTQVEMVDPVCVTVKVDKSSGRIDWYFDRVRIPTDEVWHVPGRPKLGSQFGLGLIEYMCQAAGISLAARKYEAQWFGDGAHPTSIIEPASDPGVVGAQTLKDKVMGITRGNREPLVVPTGTKVTSFQETPVNSALLEALRANSTDLAHFFGVPPELVGGASGDSMTYSNVEARVLDLLAFAVQYWMVKLEKALGRAMPARQYAKFNEAAVIRTDQETKVKTLVLSTSGGITTPNEARRPLELPPIEGGDTLRTAKPARAKEQLSAPAVHVHLGDTEIRTPDVHVDARTTVEPAQVTVDARTHVEPTTVDASFDVPEFRFTLPPQEAPVVNVTVEPSVVNVETPRSTTRRAVRDERGRITHVVDE